MALECRLSGSQSKVHSLVRSKGPFLGADLLRRAPRAGLVQDAACGTGAQRRLVLDETKRGALLVQVGAPSIIPLLSQQRLALRRSLESALVALIAVVDYFAGLALPDPPFQAP